jgi:hypothetical protein
VGIQIPILGYQYGVGDRLYQHRVYRWRCYVYWLASGSSSIQSGGEDWDSVF